MRRRNEARRHDGALRRRLDAVRDWLNRDVWSVELRGLPTFRKLLYKTTRVVFLTVRGVLENNCMFRASALTYITVLSIVPLLAFAFSVAKGLGAYDTLLEQTINPFLDSTFGTVASAEPGAEDPPPVPAGEETSLANSETGGELRKAIDTVLSFVQSTNVGSLGLFGLVILVYTVVKLLSSIEHSFNEIWGVHRARTLIRKVSDYLSMVVIVPILLVTATAVTTGAQSAKLLDYLQNELGLGPVVEFYLKFSSLVAMWVGFTFVYLFMPNTRVRVSSALLGGILGGTLWHVAQVLHVGFQLKVAGYNAIYSTFAAFPIFLFWIWASWVTVLVGAELAFAHQNEPAYRQIARARHHDHAFKEVLAVRAMARIAVAFLQGDPPLKPSSIADALNVPQRSVEDVVVQLRDRGVLAITEDELSYESTLLPARDLDHITIKTVYDALKGRSGPVDLPAVDPADREVDAVLARYEGERDRTGANLTMRELAEACLARGADPIPFPEDAGKGEDERDADTA